MNNFAVKSTKCGKSLWSVYEGLAFQSTPPRGRRPQADAAFLDIARFQSTPPRGRRHTSERPITSTTSNFNPRLREGGDIIQRGESLFCWISIHASAREATSWRRLPECGIPISIHASAREATLRDFTANTSSGYFNPRLREGGDRKHLSHQNRTHISIHASAREATLLLNDTM